MQACTWQPADPVHLFHLCLLFMHVHFDQHPCCPYATQGVYGNEEDVRALRDTLHLGDIVLVQGYREQQQQHGGSAALQARCVTLRKAWRDAACSVAFVPRPAPRGCAAASADVACEPQQLPQAAERTIEGAVLGAVEAATHPPAPPLCKFFANSMRCAKGDACPYAHTVSTGGRQAWVQERCV